MLPREIYRPEFVRDHTVVVEVEKSKTQWATESRRVSPTLREKDMPLNFARSAIAPEMSATAITANIV